MIFTFSFISIEVCERARKECTHARCTNAMSNRSYDLCLLFVSMEVREKAGEGGERCRIRGCYERWESQQPPPPNVSFEECERRKGIYFEVKGHVLRSMQDE